MIEKNKLAVGLFLASESVFFIILILSFVYFRGVWLHGQGPNPADHLKPLTTGLFSLALISSSTACSSVTGTPSFASCPSDNSSR